MQSPSFCHYNNCNRSPAGTCALRKSQHGRAAWYYLKPTSCSLSQASHVIASVWFVIRFVSLLRESLFVYLKGNWSFGDQSKLQQKVLQMGMTVISMLLNVECSLNVFVYEGAADLWLGAGVAHTQVKITCCARDHHYELTIGQCSGTINAAPGRHSTTSQCCEIFCVILYL